MLHGPVEAGSAVLRALLGLRPVEAGQLRLLGVDPAAPRRRARQALLARVGWLPRDGAFVSNLTLRENLLLPVAVHRGLPVLPPSGQALALAGEALRCFGLDEAPDLRPEQVPLPVRRRVALARAVILDPELLLVDDPLDDLDEASAAAVVAALAAWAGQGRRGLLVASPDHTLAGALRAGLLPLQVDQP